MGKRVFTRFEYKMSLGRVTFTAQGHIDIYNCLWTFMIPVDEIGHGGIQFHRAYFDAINECPHKITDCFFYR